MKKSFKTLWTENAIQDLLAIKDYISQDSLGDAEEYTGDTVIVSWAIRFVNGELTFPNVRGILRVKRPQGS